MEIKPGGLYDLVRSYGVQTVQTAGALVMAVGVYIAAEMLVTDLRKNFRYECLGPSVETIVDQSCPNGWRYGRVQPITDSKEQREKALGTMILIYAGLRAFAYRRRDKSDQPNNPF